MYLSLSKHAGRNVISIFAQAQGTYFLARKLQYVHNFDMQQILTRLFNVYIAIKIILFYHNVS